MVIFSLLVWGRLSFKNNLHLLWLTAYVLRGPLGMQHNVQTSVGRIPELLKDERVLWLMNKVWRHQIPLMESSKTLPLSCLSGKTGWVHPEEGVGDFREDSSFSEMRHWKIWGLLPLDSPSCSHSPRQHRLAMISSDTDRHAEARRCQADPGLWWSGGGMCSLRATWVWSE